MKPLFFFILMASLIGCGEPTKTKDSAWIDLTYSLDSTTLFWPNNATGFEHHVDFQGKTPGGYYYSSFRICTPKHGGTHLDAPIHFAEGKESVDQIPLDHLTGNAVVIDVSKRALQNRDYQISIEDVTEWEKENGIIPDKTMILFRTGYGQFYPKRKEYFGTELRGDSAVAQLHFPGVDPKTALWLADNRKIKALGIDVASMDYGQSKDFKTHQILLGKNIPGFENVAHLDQLPSKGIYVVALPMKIGGGSGAALRIIARVQE